MNLGRSSEPGPRPAVADLLAAEGFAVTQATLSRDLVDLQAEKVRGASGALVYAVPPEGGDMRVGRAAPTSVACAASSR